MGKFIRKVVPLLVILMSILFITYSLSANKKPVYPQKDDKNPIIMPEHKIVKEVTVGGLELSKTGKIKQTYTGTAPKECDT